MDNRTFTKNDFINRKVAIKWKQEDSLKINQFLKECNPSNGDVSGKLRYYYTESAGFPGYYTGSNNLGELSSKGIRIVEMPNLVKEDKDPNLELIGYPHQTITRKDFGVIYSLVSLEWKHKIQEVIDLHDIFTHDIIVSDFFISDMLKIASPVQRKTILTYFKNPNLFTSKDLKIGEIMKIVGGLISTYEGKHLLRTQDEFLILEDLVVTKGFFSDPIPGEKLPTGRMFSHIAK